MDTLSIQSPKYNLSGKWNLYYHLPDNNNWDIDSYTTILGDIQYAEQVIELNKQLLDSVIAKCMFFCMRSGITPLWEDPQNNKGGCFSYRILNNQVADVWRSLLYLCCGETLSTNPLYSQNINGITISPKKHFCIIKIWLNTTKFQDPSFIRQIVNLPIHGCLFKKHAPEF